MTNKTRNKESKYHQIDKSIGLRIKSRRQELGLSQTELAHLVGYRDRTAVSKIENGERDLRQSRIVDFARALDTTIDYIMGWTEKEVTIQLIDREAQKLDQEDRLRVYERILTLLENDKYK